MSCSTSTLLAVCPRLPDELCCMVLREMSPSDAWACRVVCKTWNLYVLRVLTRSAFLPLVSVFIRRAESWIFYQPTVAEKDDEDEDGDEESYRAAQCYHFGNEFSFSRVDGAMAVFSPARPTASQNRELLWRLEDEVQVIVQFGALERGKSYPRCFRHIRIPSLSIDRRSMELSLQWRPLLDIVLVMPEDVRVERDTSLRPSILWIPGGDREGEGSEGEWVESKEDEFDCYATDSDASTELDW
ncbi:hypothetical protein BOTBODRAFT_30529 [Botryobasidium botryosum FD-172 SS1]|uniref:Ig-like domain-containing protein n=1 Tax=Botryobasidium botryosum (strain FD-172 SS1) TaxID=930990 RepID=A0A067MXI2_BOTB1|nr:hypothetical protein BOTBODRAFT_30529 [Botryobasidium botryosum FD-172 SS1]